ncbi:hypothetical protein L6164_009234 [Bauhinia variegata]|uniref:Uncharacterized protein n=1 Tax=Bauhinia variegata TaxID=167791 RepID=A0ACB9PIG7_BAUVA|nr:hypothetical protein L6164_009234 [Bauhinia variegata]
MATRKEEERNEKIIRGLMKLPPNRRCINCNSLGPQYVCTNFWTCVCITCSGIHREFTHRVKSVSMAKFTSQEVDALQNGGNQRAREVYLKDWDFQRQRLPDSSNVNKIREFIKNVYVDRRYAGARSSDKPPRDMQGPRIHEEETRRASSYHSYSQSPPYDYQYEDWRYGKQAAALTRKPGSDKGRYEGKMSSFIYSPGRFSDHGTDDRFANEGVGPRLSDFSVSSGGDQFKSGVQSPEFHKDIGISSPPYLHSNASSSDDLWSQRTASLGSLDQASFSSYNSGGLVDFFSEPVQTSEFLQDKVSGIPRPSAPARSVSSHLPRAPVEPEPILSSASSVDIFQLPASSQSTSVDLFQPSVSSTASSLNESQPSQTFQPSPVDLFAEISQEQSSAKSDEKSPELSIPRDEGWATFDMPECTVSTVQVENTTGVPSTDETFLGRFNPFSTFNGGTQWPSSETSSVHKSSSVSSNPWHDGVWNENEQVAITATNTQPWNAFEDSGSQLPIEVLNQALNLPSADGQILGLRASEGSDNGGMLAVAPVVGSHYHNIASHIASGLPCPSPLPLGETQTNTINHKSTNPFDIPFDSDIEQSNMFLNMSSLQAALPVPDAQLPSTFHNGIAEPWLPQNSATSYISAAGEGGLTYMAAQPPSSQIPNVQTHGPVASVGGNPFA